MLGSCLGILPKDDRGRRKQIAGAQRSVWTSAVHVVVLGDIFWLLSLTEIQGENLAAKNKLKWGDYCLADKFLEL